MPLKDSSRIIRTALLDIPELRSDYHPPKNSKPSSFLEDLQDSFSNTSFEDAQKKVVSICSAHKNTLGDATATVTGSTGTVVKHGATLLRYSSQLVSTTSSLAPICSVVGSTIFLLKDAYTQEIVENRLAATKALYQYAIRKHFPDGLNDLEPNISLSELHTPTNHTLRACETMLHTLDFSMMKMERRIQKLKTQQLGSSMVLAGAVTTAAGSAFLGFGAIPGIGIAAAGSAVNLSPTVYGIGKAAYKKFQGTKGVIRKSSAEFIWALALHKAVSEKLISKNEIRDNQSAQGAYCLATEWHYLRDKDDVESAQHIAHLFLQHMGIFENLELTSPDFLKKIESRLKSTPK